MQNAYSKNGGQGMTDAKLLGMIGIIINNAGDWEGGRENRKRKHYQDNDHENEDIIN